MRKYNDKDRFDFINALDKAPIELTAKEAAFIESVIDKKRLSTKDRKIIDKLLIRHGAQCGF